MLFPIDSRQCELTVLLTITVYISSEAWRMMTCMISSSPVSISSTREQLVQAGKGGSSPGQLFTPESQTHFSVLLRITVAGTSDVLHNGRLPANRGQASYSLRSQSHRVIQSFNNLGMSEAAKLSQVQEAAAQNIWIQ